MILMGTLMVALGAIGIWQSTVGNAGIAWVITRINARLGRRTRPERFSAQRGNSTQAAPLTLDLLVPAHNEEATIAKTLASLRRAQVCATLGNSNLSANVAVNIAVNITVALDHCTDGTESIIDRMNHRGKKIQVLRLGGSHGGSYGGSHVADATPNASKWNTLQRLIRQSRADWVGLVDAGAVWEEDLLPALLPRFLDPGTLAVAPAYSPLRGGLFEALHWKFERLLKRLENAAGGPVSVHGATVFYRRSELVRTLDALTAISSSKNWLNHWLNDDVVIPLTMRTLWPAGKIDYVTREGHAWVRDYGLQVARSPGSKEIGRRRRMLVGNLQWIRSLYLPAWRADPVVGLIASRRLFRTFWAYWALFLGTGALTLAYSQFAHAIPLSPSVGVAFLLGAAALVLTVGRLRSAFLAGLELPYLWLTAAQSGREKLWN